MSAVVEQRWAPTLIQAEDLRMSLRRFWKGAWPHVDPAPLIWGWHLDAISDHLAYVALGDIRFLLINISPRTTKSLGTCVVFPVWDWLQDPSVQFLTASYALQLSTRDCLRSRRLIDSVWFQERWGHEFRFAFDEKLKRQYSNDKGGRRIALSVDGATTGEGGDILICLAPGTKISTDSGLLPIEEIVCGNLPVKVVTYDHRRKALALRGIEAFESGPPRDMVLVDFGRGSVVVTIDHPVFEASRGYVRADTLRPGDEVFIYDEAVYKLQKERRPDGKLDFSLFELSSQDTRPFFYDQPRVESATIRVVAPAPRTEKVYNLKVAVDHNYFANGLLVHNCDDPHNATEVESDLIRLGTHDWWDNAMTSRMNQPDKSAWILTGQRTGEDDLFGHVLKTHDTKDIVQLMLPNEYDVRRRCVTRLPKSKKVIFSDPRKVEGELLCPTRISAQATKRLKRVMKDKYHLQYQQDSEAGGGAILRRDKWKCWDGEPPEVELLLSVYDTAFGEKQENDYSARTTWGIFKHRETTTNPQTGAVSYGKERRHIILLGAWRDKLAYHDLKREARDHYRKVRDDYTLVEHKGTGIILARDLIRGGVRGVRKVRIDHGGRVKMDKIERAKLASTVLDDGLVYYMGGRKWAKAVIDECTNFPKGTYDDWVDTAVMAWQFLRRMGEAKLWEQEDADGGVRLFKMSDKGKRALYG